MFTAYQIIAQEFTGWSLTEIKDMAVREREYWVSMVKYKMEYRAWQKRTQPNRA